jgi:hypothetical protein
MGAANEAKCAIALDDLTTALRKSTLNYVYVYVYVYV